jgi:pimeloyl-ACP methyl ester carboxylesterase
MKKSTKLILTNSDERVIAARDAEAHFFNYYNLKPIIHYVLLKPFDIHIRCIEIGAGEPVIIVPGNTGDGFPFIPLVSEIKNKKIIIINRPGGGLSDGMNHSEVNLREFACQTITTVLDFFKIDKTSIIAHSIGGHWSLWFTMDKPERVISLVLLGVPGNVLTTCPPFLLRLASVPVFNRLFFLLINRQTKTKSLKSLLFMGHSETTIKNLPMGLAECYFHFQKLPYYGISTLSLMEKINCLSGSKPEIRINENELKNIKKRVLLIWGTNDPFGKIEAGRKIAQLLPMGEFHEIPGGGHLPWLDEPKKCAELIMYSFPPRPRPYCAISSQYSNYSSSVMDTV